MNKKIKLLLVLILSIALLGLAFYLGTYSVKNGPASISQRNLTCFAKQTLMTSDEKAALNLDHLSTYEVRARNKSGLPTDYRFIRVDDPQPIKLEFMTDQEKVSFNVDPKLKIQVLERDSNGKIISYHIIKDNSDIVTKY